MRLINTISLFIFDMDGLMFDTTNLAIYSWIKAGNTYGIPISESIVIKSIGLDIHGAKKVFKKNLGKNFPYHEIRSLRLKYAQDFIEKNGIPVKKGLYELIEFLDQKPVLKAVATSTERERTEQFLLSAGVKEKFDLIVCGDDVSKGKPEPDIFITVSEKLNCKSNESVVLEDSANGILAASRANMIPFLVFDVKKPDENIEKLAEKTFNSLVEVRDFLQKIDF